VPVVVLLLACASAFAQTAPPLQQYLIEREIKGAGAMTPAQLRDAAQKSNGVLRVLGPDDRQPQALIHESMPSGSARWVGAQCIVDEHRWPRQPDRAGMLAGCTPAGRCP
jgi:hypothetical protein